MFTACGLSKKFPGLPPENFWQHLIGMPSADRIKTFFSYLKEQKTCDQTGNFNNSH